jgi:nucleoporin NUP2
VESAKKAVEADMFCDLGMAFKQYKEFREKVVKDYEDAKRASGVIADVVKSVETAKPAEAKPSFGFGTAAGASSKDSPFSFGSSKPSAPPASTSAPTSKPSPFSLNLPSAKPTAFGSMDPSLVTPAPTPPVQPPSPRKPVATFNATESALPEATPTPSPMPDGHAPNMFDIAAAKSDAPTPNPIVPEGKEKVPSVFETTAAKAASTAPTTKPAFTFGSSTTTFGSTTSTKPDVKPFSFSTSNSAGFSGFGNSSGAPTPALSTTATAGSSVPPSTKPFSFTTPLSTPGTPFAFGAGSPKGNTTPRPGGSVGFSFGNSPPRKDAPGFPFGASVSAAVTPKSEKGPSDEEKEQTKEGESEKPAGEGEVADGEEVDRAQTAGAGEENEDTLYSSRARVLRFNKTAWVGVGIGQFKIKYDRETKKRRILHRLEGTGRVVVVSAKY